MKLNTFLIGITACLIICAGCVNRAAKIDDRGTWIGLADEDGIDGYNMVCGTIWSDSINSECDVWCDYIEEIDSASFRVCRGSGYAKDIHHVFFTPEHIPGTIVDPWIGLFSIVDADPKTFKHIGDGYAVDRKNLFYRGVVIDWNQTLVDSLTGLNRTPN